MQPLLAGLAGRPLPDLPGAPLLGNVRPAPGHTRIVPVRWQRYGVRAVDGAHSGYLGPAALADALAAVPPEWEECDVADLLTTAPV
ncbi:hypothetical protein [Dactylosporangium sp. NPDC048998]|uniref:hypothetical protein n=1 Tax=Dactylosporangium sp. NPDC048998 TaxID=3363976 RepID=UPI0037199362